MSAQATTEAADEADDEVVTDARSGTLPTTKDAEVTPVPEPIETEEAQSTTLSSGISVPQVLGGGWGSKYHITNMWKGLVSSDTFIAIAGSKADDPAAGVWDDPEQGLLLVGAAGSDTLDEYLAPSQAGKIQVSSYSGTCLTLTTVPTGIGSGTTTYHFDVATLDWSCSP